MDIAKVLELFTQVVSNLGVPVGLLIGCFWLLNKEREDHKAEVTAEREAHKAEVKELSESFANGTKEMITAINNNTLVMQSIRDKLS